MRRYLDPPCELHAGWQDCPDVILTRLPTGGMGIPLRDGDPPGTAETVVLIAFCPWCGSQLPDPSPDGVRQLWLGP